MKGTQFNDSTHVLDNVITETSTLCLKQKKMAKDKSPGSYAEKSYVVI